MKFSGRSRRWRHRQRPTSAPGNRRHRRADVAFGLGAVALVLLTSPRSASAQMAEIALLKQINGNSAASDTKDDVPEPTPTCPQFFFSRNLVRGMQGADVRALQSFLNENGWLSSDNVTGVFEPNTEAAVKAFQATKGIPQVGTVGPLTRNALIEYCELTSSIRQRIRTHRADWQPWSMARTSSSIRIRTPTRSSVR
jgi:Putative peptidoglycan binding domain